MAGTGWSWGASLILQPGYETQQTDRQITHRSANRALDAFALWRMDRRTQLRVAVANLLAPTFDHYEQTPADERADIARAVQSLTDGRLVYVEAMRRAMVHLGRGHDPLSALTSLLVPGGDLDEWCRFRYELRLHRARGYGALKAILARRKRGARIEIHAFRRDELLRFEVELASPPASEAKLSPLERPKAPAASLRRGWLGAA